MNQVYSIRITYVLPYEGAEWRSCLTPEEHRYLSDEYLFDMLKQRALHAFRTDEGRVFDIKNGWRPFEKPRSFPPEAAMSTKELQEIDPEADGKNLLAARLIDAWCADKGHQIPWSKAIDIVAIITGLPLEEVKRLKEL